ncbi:MAG: esterase [Cellulomonas sp. 73-145]|uniref:alpha/beta hydrolase fold domain-containing protein n=1 Tax=Cellulomonas sp. 73-145 TaxID=1895739 RepID=UPI000927052B|nr:alpha/beta hydrolase fold domain-containing protein [Cellulomonas sp. 73-145]OJV59119.1 MAG: esterase [Cellulomonas sp. 73-145]
MRTSTPRPPFDPQIAAALAAHGDVVTSLAAADIPALRRRVAAPDVAAITRGGTYRMTSHRVPGTGTAPEVALTLVRPVVADRPLPVLYHLHGGGMVTGAAHEELPWLVDVAAQIGAAVAAVEYRLAPEWRYPAALDDSYAGLVWLVEHAAELGLDPGLVVICGVSAGAGLAAATALAARDRGAPHLAGQLLVYPMLDDRNDSASGRQMAGAGAWDRQANATGWSAYLGDRVGGPDVPDYAAPARAEDLGGLPPTYLEVASAETFRDEDLRYAARLWACGGDAELHVWPGGCHGFDFLAPEAELSRAARAARVSWLIRTLARATGDGVLTGLAASTLDGEPTR